MSLYHILGKEDVDLSYSDFNSDVKTGEILSDKRKSGKERPWKLYKRQSLIYAGALERLGFSKRAERVSDCGSFLLFIECPRGHEKRLRKMPSCKDRFCILCMARRSLAVSWQIFCVCHMALHKNSSLRFLSLTLTIPNVGMDNLSEGVGKLLKGWDRLQKRREVKPVILGYFRSLEVTYNPDRNDWHPHFHILLVVSSSYFKGGNYIKHERWLELWRESARDESITDVDIRPIKNRGTTEETLARAAAEFGKYMIKPAAKDSKEIKKHIFIRATEEETDKAVSQLMAGLSHRKLTHWGGMLKEIYRELKLKDVDSEEVDLTYIQNNGGTHTCSVCGTEMWEHLYRYIESRQEYVG